MRFTGFVSGSGIYLLLKADYTDIQSKVLTNLLGQENLVKYFITTECKELFFCHQNLLQIKEEMAYILEKISKWSSNICKIVWSAAINRNYDMFYGWCYSAWNRVTNETYFNWLSSLVMYGHRYVK